jgi:hypothetical protein
MNLAMLKEDRWAARKKYAEYLAAVKQRHTAEYVALKNAYREIVRGRQIIDIVATMRAAGLDSRSRPKLAILRADAKICWFDWSGAVPTFSTQQSSYRRPKSKTIALPADTFQSVPWEVRSRIGTCRSRAVDSASLSAGRQTRKVLHPLGGRVGIAAGRSGAAAPSWSQSVHCYRTVGFDTIGACRVAADAE